MRTNALLPRMKILVAVLLHCGAGRAGVAVVFVNAGAFTYRLMTEGKLFRRGY